MERPTDQLSAEPLPKIEHPTMADLLAPGPLPEHVLGSADAPVTVIEYASMTCPYCRAFQERGFAELKHSYIDTGKVRLIIREFPIGKSSGAATIANRCIAEAKYVALFSRLLKEQGAWVSLDVRRDAIFEVARKEGLTRAQFDACFEDQALAQGLQAIKERGRRLGVVGTPTFFVGEKKLRTSPTWDNLRADIEAALAARGTQSALPR